MILMIYIWCVYVYFLCLHVLLSVCEKAHAWGMKEWEEEQREFETETQHGILWVFLKEVLNICAWIQ